MNYILNYFANNTFQSNEKHKKYRCRNSSKSTRQILETDAKWIVFIISVTSIPSLYGGQDLQN